MTTTRTVEVHLEELGEEPALQRADSWIAAALNALGGATGGEYRFVARSADDDSGAATTVLEGATFPMMRFLDLNALQEPNPSTDIAQRLADLDRDLVADGWRRQETSGRHWWSRTYEKA